MINRIKIFFPFAGLILLTGSCAERKQEKVNEHNDRETSEVIEPLPKRVHNEVSIKRYFSSQKAEDIFTLKLIGEDYKTASLVFSITRDGDTLFMRKATGSDILSTAAEDAIKSEKDEEEYIRQVMSTFFAETSFSSPPYTLNDPQRDEFKGNMAVWEEIKNDTASWCFEFSLSSTGGTEVLTYSKILDSVIVYDGTP